MLAVSISGKVSSWLVGDCLLMSSHALSSVCKETEMSGVSSSFYKDTSSVGLGPHPYDPTYLVKGPISLFLISYSIVIFSCGSVC